MLSREGRGFGSIVLSAVGVAAMLLSGATVSAQGQRASGAMTVSVTVVRSCTVDSGSTSQSSNATASPAATSASVRVCCGPSTQAASTLAAPGQPPTGSLTAPSVSRSTDGRTVVVQF